MDDVAARDRRAWRPTLPGRIGVLAILIATLVAAGGVASSILRSTPIYQSTAVLLIDQPSLIVKANNEGPIQKLNQLRPKYAVLARTAPLTEPVAQRLGLSPGQVAGAVAVALPGPSLVMIVAARTDRPNRSRDIADAMAEQLATFLSDEQKAANIPEADRIILRRVASARPGAKIEPTRSRAILNGTLAGILTLAGGFLLYQLPRRRSPS